MENTIENKAKFFAQYWGQEVLFHTNSRPQFTTFESLISSVVVINSYCAYLKPLSLITDEDAAGMPAFNWPSAEILLQYYSYKDFRVDLLLKDLKHIDFDYLRSKGYALPWMGLTVEKQIEYGWIKLSSTT